MKELRQIFFSVVVALLLFSSLVYGDTWTANKRLTNTAGESGSPAIAVHGSNIYVVWEDDTPGNGEIYFKRSVNGGATWNATRRLTSNAGDSNAPAIAVNGSNIYVVWEDDTPGNGEIFFKKSVDGGVTWNATRRLTKTAEWSMGPAIGVNGPYIYVVWSDWTPGNVDIYFKRSADGGVTWTADKRLVTNTNHNWNPSIAVNGPNIYLVWYDLMVGEGMYFKRSVDRGVTWSANRRFVSNADAALSWNIALAVDGPDIYVVWEDLTQGNENEICFKRSVNEGATWAANRRITNNAGHSRIPDIAVDGSNIYVAWDDDMPGNREIYFKRSIDGGVTWTANRRLTSNAGNSYAPTIAVNGSAIYLVWSDETPGNREIFFKKGVFD